MSQTLPNSRKAGFTLIEMMAVIAIVALIAGLVASRLPGTGVARLKALTLDTADLLRRERLGAVLSGRSRQVFLDNQTRRLVGEGGRSVAIPGDVVLNVLGSDQAGAAVVRFDADGASSGAALKLSREGVAYEILVNWYTGAIKIVAP